MCKFLYNFRPINEEQLGKSHKPSGKNRTRGPTIPVQRSNQLGLWFPQGLIPRALFLGEMRNISPVSFEL